MAEERPRRPWSARRRSRPSRADVVPAGRRAPLHDGAEGRIEVAPGIAVWYRVLGAGSELVVVPTAGNDRDLHALAAPGRTIVFYDVRGRGRSDSVGAADAGFVEEVADLGTIQRAFGIDRFAVVGCSYQAGVVVSHALEHPGTVSRLVLAAPIAVRAGARPSPARQPAPHQVAHLDQLEAAGLRSSDPAALCRAWREVYVPLLMGRPDAFTRLTPVCDLPNEHPWTVARSLVHVFAQLPTYDWRPALRHLDVPTLVVHGSEDLHPVEHAVEWIDALSDARLLELDGIGQFPWAEDPDRFFDVVGRFLAGEPT
jgi:proline iminopeptidase